MERGRRRLGLSVALAALVGCGGGSADGPETWTSSWVERGPDAVDVQVEESLRGDTRLVKQSHGIDDERATAVAIDGQRNILVLASFRAVADFGMGPLVAPCPAGANLALVKYRWDGQPLWVKAFGTTPGCTGGAEAHTLAVDANGDIVFAGRSEGTIDFGRGRLPAGGFLVRFSTEGQPLWSRRLDAEVDLTDSAMVIDRSGNIALAGSFEGILDFGTGALPSASWFDGPAPSAFLAKFDAQGRTRWVYADPLPSDGFGVAAEGDGDLVLGGWEAVGYRQFGQPMVLKFNPSGTPVWARRLEALGALRKVSVQGSTLAAAGHFESEFLFAGRTLTPHGRGMLLVAFENATGNEAWGTSLDAEPRGLAMGADGVFVAGSYRNGADLGLGPLPGAPGLAASNVFAARYHRLTGRPLWTRGFVATALAEVASVATSATGDSVIVGSFRDGTVDFGTGALVPESRDLFLLGLMP